MEFNKNKLVFWVIGGLILLSIVFLLITITNKNKESVKTGASWEVFKIWTFWNSMTDSLGFIDWFKNVNPDYKNREIVVENFTSYEDYTYTLMSALTSWKWPDLFVLNNNEKNTVFTNQILWLDPATINPNDFRKRYKGFFSDDLISTYSDSAWTTEFLIWMPVWYETLWIYYNRKYAKDSDLKNLASLNNIVSDLKNKYSDLIPIWIWNGSTVFDAQDIITQFFMLEWWVTWISNVNQSVLKSAISSYLLYGDTTWYNWYNSRFQELKDTKKDSIYLFSRWEVLMVVWYPSMLKKIKESGFSKSMLQVTPFPHYFSGGWTTLADYNYFVVNKDSTNIALANSIIAYLYSDAWATSFLSYNTDQLPALLSLESDKLQQKVDPDYTIILWDFYNEEYELSSFDKWIKNIYDKNIVSLLDTNVNNEDIFLQFKDSILCKVNKMLTFTNLWANCN